MKIKCFLIAVCGICLFATAKATKPDSINVNTLEGVWVLDSVNIKQITKSGDTIAVPYVKKTYANTTDCVFPVLKLEKEQCIIGDTEMIPNYSIKNDTIILWFTAPVEFKCTISSGKTLTMIRQYSNYGNNEVDSILLNLVYIKQ
jgi:hypothetical protein